MRCLEIFVEVARDGSFTGAARRLAISKSTVTKYVAWLEHSLGARLVERGTTQAGLTEAGRTVLASGQLLLDSYDEMDLQVRAGMTEARGLVRVGVPPSFGAHHLIPVVVAFGKRYPKMQVSVVLDTGESSFALQAVDVSLRIAPGLEDSSNIAVRLTSAPQTLVAAPAYLHGRPHPQQPSDLASHNCLVHSLKAPTSIWRFQGPAGEVSIHVAGNIMSNFGESLKEAAILGHGISIHPYYMVSDDLKAGRLVALLPDYRPTDLEIYMLYQTREKLPVRVKAFLQFLRDWFKTTPEWALPPPRAARLAPGLVSIPKQAVAANER